MTEYSKLSESITVSETVSVRIDKSMIIGKSVGIDNNMRIGKSVRID